MFSNNSTALEYKMSPGELLRYRSTVSSQQTIKEEGQEPQKMGSSLEIVMGQAVRAVHNGVADIDVTIESGSITHDQDELPLDTVGQKISMQMKRNGDVVSTSVDFPFSQPSFPERPLKPGDTWNNTNKMNVPIGENGETKSVDLVYKYTLTKFDHINGYDVAVINITCPPVTIDLQPDARQTIQAEGCTNFAHAQGRLVSSTVHTHTEVDVPETSITTDIRVSVELLDASNTSDSNANTFGQSDELFIIGT